jgi:hypothetical protein
VTERRCFLLPPQPQTTEENRNRFPAAVRRVFFVEDIERGGERPGQLREHVFDWPDGLRLIISREDFGDMQPVLHMSASANKEYPLWRRLAKGKVSISDFLDLAALRFFEISKGTHALVFEGFSIPKGIPHWRGIEVEKVRKADAVSASP